MTGFLVPWQAECLAKWRCGVEIVHYQGLPMFVDRFEPATRRRPIIERDADGQPTRLLP